MNEFHRHTLKLMEEFDAYRQANHFDDSYTGKDLEELVLDLKMTAYKWDPSAPLTEEIRKADYGKGVEYCTTVNAETVAYYLRKLLEYTAE